MTLDELEKVNSIIFSEYIRLKEDDSFTDEQKLDILAGRIRGRLIFDHLEKLENDAA
jgi:hypothetical protein